MSKHFSLLLELDLLVELPEEDLQVVRRLIGLTPSGPENERYDVWTEPRPPSGADIADPPAQELPIPGGPTAQLVRRVVSMGLSRQEVRWSLAVRALLIDDSFYEEGWRTVDWLARRSATRGFIGQAREELDLVPSWTFFAADGFGYVTVRGEVFALSQEAPPPPADLTTNER